MDGRLPITDKPEIQVGFTVTPDTKAFSSKKRRLADAAVKPLNDDDIFDLRISE